MISLHFLSLLAATRCLQTSWYVTLPKDLFGISQCLHLFFVSRFHSKFIFCSLRSVRNFRYNNDVISCLAFKEERRRGSAKGFGHSGPLPCSSSFTGNIGCLAGVQWTWSGQHQVHDPLMKHQKTRSNRTQQTKSTSIPKPFFLWSATGCLMLG